MAISKRAVYQKKIDAAIKARNPDVVSIPTVKKVVLPGEKPPKNPNTSSGHFHRRKWVRSDGTTESRIQVYLTEEMARDMRLFCAKANNGDGVSMSAFMERAVGDLLKKLGPSGRW